MPDIGPTPIWQEAVLMNESQEPAPKTYPHGRGYGHDYMRGGEVLGGYGYAEREEYSKSRGEVEGKERPLTPAKPK